MRKLALRQAMDKQLPYTKISPESLEDLLGKPPFTRDSIPRQQIVQELSQV